jgi:hypothetical protein
MVQLVDGEAVVVKDICVTERGTKEIVGPAKGMVLDHLIFFTIRSAHPKTRWMAASLGCRP